MKKSKHTLGFTLVELLLVIILIAVLASIAVPRFSDSTLRSKESSLSSNLRLIRLAADRAEVDTGLTFPVSALDDASPPANGWVRAKMNTDWILKPVPSGTWRGPYLSQIPVNPFTKNDSYSGAATSSTTIAWTHYSKQPFNSSHHYYPSTVVGTNGKPYREW